jgi:tetratricopeptide (TPR) repeat protein
MPPTRIIGSMNVAVLLLLCASWGLALPPAPAATPILPPAEEKADAKDVFDKVKEWRAAVAQHDAGKPDTAAKLIGRWPIKDLELVVAFMSKLGAQPQSAIKHTLSKARYRRALDTTDQEAKSGDFNRILKQGALLHTDIALLDLQTWAYQEISEATGAFVDGRILIQPRKFHWEFARRLIDSVGPVAAKDPMVRQWYIATTAHMQNHRLLGYAGQNIKRALVQFPSDEQILFYAGVLHELWASPVNQNVLLPKEAKVSYGTREAELKLAQEFFQKAVAINPNFAEAHLRLGRVLGQLGNPRKAATELLQAAAAIKDTQLLYYASLFLGYEFYRLARLTEAQEQYDRASMLYPAAQSPLLALSHLARISGKAKDAHLDMQRVFELPHADPWNDDPWWTYDLAHVRNADALVAQMHKLFGDLPR